MGSCYDTDTKNKAKTKAKTRAGEEEMLIGNGRKETSNKTSFGEVRTMMKKWMCLMAAMMLSCCFAQGAFAAAWLPDIGPVLGVQGSLINTVYRSDTREKMNVYRYEFVADGEFLVKQMFAYMRALEEMGMKFQAIKMEGAVIAYHIELGSTAAQVGAGIQDYDSFNSGGKTLTRVVFFVPEGCEFVLGQGPLGMKNGRLTCSSCRGTRICKFCGGRGRLGRVFNYEDCTACQSGVCGICDGTGVR